MGVLTRYLDLLPAEARERVLRAERWTTRTYVDQKGARDLLGHAEDWSWPEPGGVPSCGAPTIFHLRASAGDELWTDEPLIGTRFDRLVQRRGLEPAVALIKSRVEHGKQRAPHTLLRRGHLTLLSCAPDGQ